MSLGQKPKYKCVFLSYTNLVAVAQNIVQLLWSERQQNKNNENSVIIGVSYVPVAPVAGPIEMILTNKLP